ASLKAEIETLKSNAKAADDWMKAASENLAGIAKEKEELTTKASSADVEVMNLKAEIDTLKSTSEELTTKLNEAGSSSDEAAACRAEIETLKSNAKAADDWMKMASENVTNLTKENEILTAKLNDASSASNSNSEEVTLLRSEVESLRNNAAASDKWMQSASANLSSLEQEKAGLSSELASVQAILDEKLKIIATGTEEILALRKTASKMKEVEEAAKLADMYKSEAEAASAVSSEKQAECQQHLKTIADLREWSSRAQEEMVGRDSTISELRAQLDQLSTEKINMMTEHQEARAKAIQHQSALQELESAKIRAEEEVLSLKTDMTFLSKSNVEGVQEKIIEARREEEERVLAIMRREVEEMRVKMLQSDEAENMAKTILRTTEQKLAEVRLQLSMYEREVEAMKTDSKYLRETLDRTKERNNESSANFKKRIYALEREREDILESNLAEVRALREELKNTGTDRDHQKRLAEEKEKDLILLNESVRGDGEMGEREIDRLRYEKAQLLQSANHAAANFERKMREAIAASAGKREAELILEREGKKQAEMTSEGLRTEVSELQATVRALGEGGKGGEGESAATAAMGKVRVELDNVRKENETVRGENARLTQRITANFEEMQRANAILTERAKMAEMRVKQVEERETEGRVRLERARLREEGLSDSMFSPGGTGRGLGGDAQLFHRVVAELQREVEEGRAMFSELEGEHEDLLALLAQQEIEKESLKGALRGATREEETVERAMKEAESVCIQRFNQYVTLET
ncbi:hypothetical protein TrVE_jg231, partial [Triparma verrucosa]